MNLRCVLAATGTLLAFGNATSFTMEQTTILTGSKAFLRSSKDATEKNDNTNVNNEMNDEERMINLKQLFGLEEKAPNIFAKKIVSKMKDDNEFKLQEKLSVAEVRLKLKVPYKKRNLELLLEYINHVYPAKIPEVSRNQRVHFGEVDVRHFDTDEMTEWLKHFGR